MHLLDRPDTKSASQLQRDRTVACKIVPFEDILLARGAC